MCVTVFVVGHFILNLIQVMTKPEVTMFEVVVQKGHVRKHTDPIHVITCNYEYGGSQQSDTEDTSQWFVFTTKVPFVVES